MSSSLFAGRELDVFLSFRGKIHLVNDFVYYLSENGIKSFKSDSWKEKNFRGVDQQIIKALKESKVAVVMMSEKQPGSGFLEELLVILDFQEKRSLTVIPIFLTEHPLDLDKVSQLFPERAQIWRSAMTKLDNICTHYSFSRSRGGMRELERIIRIADDILIMFLSSASSDFNGLVGMDRHLKAFYELLALESDKEVRTVGIWGKAGVGKTTLARFIFEEISVKFQTHVFLENVEKMKEKLLPSENVENKKEKPLPSENVENKKENLLPSEKFAEEEYLTSSDHEKNEITEARNKHRNILVIADGVNNIEQGKWIAEYANWFAPGSRVILITQDKSVLEDSGVNHVYEVGSLRYDEALQLFSLFAFKQPYPPSDFEQLAVRAVRLAGFLPMTIRLFGSFLTGRSKEEWEATLLKLIAKQSKDIMEVWKLMEASEGNDISQKHHKDKHP